MPQLPPHSEEAFHARQVFSKKMVAYLLGLESVDDIDWETKDERLVVIRKLTRNVFFANNVSLAEIRAWMVGLDPELGDRSPAEVLREGDIRAFEESALRYVIG